MDVINSNLATLEAEATKEMMKVSSKGPFLSLVAIPGRINLQDRRTHISFLLKVTTGLIGTRFWEGLRMANLENTIQIAN